MVKAWAFWPTKRLAQVVLAPFFSIRVQGKENLPRDTGFVLLPKHQRWVDIPLLSLAASRPLYYVAKYELFRIPPIGWYLKSLGGIPLNRAQPVRTKSSLQKVLAALSSGQGVVVFPEGTYYEGKIGPVRTGVIWFILNRIEVPYVPVGIHYRKGFWRTKVNIRFGAPIFASSAPGLASFMEEIMKKIVGLSGLV